MKFDLDLRTEESQDIIEENMSRLSVQNNLKEELHRNMILNFDNIWKKRAPWRGEYYETKLEKFLQYASG